MSTTYASDALAKPLSRSLLVLRLGVFIVMLMWTLDKFFNPAHSSKVFESFYGIDWLSHNFSYIMGFIELALVIGFVTGFSRRWTYGGIL